VVVTVSVTSAPELHAHSVMYALPAGENELLGHSWHGWFIAGFHWLAAHDDTGTGGGVAGGGGGGGAGSQV